MRIGIEAQRLFRRKKHGMDIVALELVTNLERIDKDNDYFIFVKTGRDHCFKSSKRFRVIELPGEPYPVWEQVVLPIAAAVYKCDLLHCTSNTAPIFSKVPLVLTLHDIFFLEQTIFRESRFSNYQRLGNHYRRIIVPYIVPKCKKVITVSNSEKNRINNFFTFKKNTFSVISNGVGNRFQQINDRAYLDSIKSKYRLPDEFIFFIGNTDPKKNTIGVLRAYSIFLKKFSFKIPLVVADLSRTTLTRMLAGIKDCDLVSNIQLLNYVPNSDMSGIYNLCSLFLYPSVRESFGIPILEAQACGAPVITSSLFSMPEVAGDAAYLIDPTNSEEIANAIHLLLSNSEIRNDLIQKGFVQSKKFTWGKMANEVLSVYKETYKK